MDKYLKQALHEFNMSGPASAPFLRFEQLTASQQTRVEQRAEDLATADLEQWASETLASVVEA